MKRILVILGALVTAFLTYALLPAQVEELARRAAAIFVAAAVFWAGRPVPLFVTSLGVVVVAVFLLAEEGGFARAGGIEAQTFLNPFASDIMMLFFGGLLLSAALSRHGVDRAIASRVLRPLAGRPVLLLYAVMGITAFFSMWMSNTAATAMVLAVVGSLVRQAPDRERFVAGLFLAVAIGANIGGIGTPIGTPPNAIAVSALRNAGFEVTFLRWMMMAVPLAIVLLGATGIILYWMYRPQYKDLRVAGQEVEPMGAAGRLTLVVLALAIGAWLSSAWHGVPDGVIALTAAFVLAALGLIGRKEIKGIQWPVLILIWGGLSLGTAMQETGLVSHLAQLPLDALPDFMLAGLVMVVAVGLSLFISNTATAALLVPIILALAVPHEGLLVVLTALACSFAMAMPMSTPPNALAYGTGRIQFADLLRTGGLVVVMSIVAVMAGYRMMVPLTLPVGP